MIPKRETHLCAFCKSPSTPSNRASFLLSWSAFACSCSLNLNSRAKPHNSCTNLLLTSRAAALSSSAFTAALASRYRIRADMAYRQGRHVEREGRWRDSLQQDHISVGKCIQHLESEMVFLKLVTRFLQPLLFYGRDHRLCTYLPLQSSMHHVNPSIGVFICEAQSRQLTGITI